jgi:hypothetical protein
MAPSRTKTNERPERRHPVETVYVLALFILPIPIATGTIIAWGILVNAIL